MMMLVIDVGNTSTHIGYYADGCVSDKGRCPSRFTDAVEVERLITLKPVKQVVIATVIPEVKARWDALLEKLGLPAAVWVSPELDLGVAVDYPKPESIGQDRLANAAAAARDLGTPSVVCDFGTALTFDILDAEKGYVGGIICPGLPLMFDYLAEKTAQLPHLKPIKTDTMIGRSTEQAMQIGALEGYRGMIREILDKLRTELHAPELAVCCTGGYAGWLFEDWDVEAVIDPDLTLRGLGYIGELNCA